MKMQLEKIRLIFLPFLIIAISFVLLYTLLNWLFFIEWDTFHVRDDVRTFWLPVTLPFIPVYFWLRPRIRLLNLKRKDNDNLPFFYQFMAVCAIAVTTILAQAYVETATGKLQMLASVKEINQKEKAKYYDILRFYPYKNMMGLHRTAEVGGKNNENLTFYDYYAVPLFERSSDTSSGDCSAWLGVKYSERISNHLSDLEKDEKYRAFTEQTQRDFAALQIPSLSFVERLGYTDETNGFVTAVRTSVAAAKGEVVVLKKLEGTYAGRNGNKLSWIGGALAIGAVVFLIMTLIPSVNESEKRKLLHGVKNREQSGLKDFAELFRFRDGYKATPLLLILNLSVFLVMVFAGLGLLSFDGRDLLSWGANFRPKVEDGEAWRLVTSMFLHAGIMHLLSNMLGLVFIGLFLEPKIETKKFVLAYLITGIAGSLTSLWWHTATVSVGASGAIFGMNGLFLALLLRKRFPPDFSKAFLSVTMIFISYNLLMGLGGGIDNAAHIGGLVSGFVIGLLLRFTLQDDSTLPKKQRKKQTELVTGDL